MGRFFGPQPNAYKKGHKVSDEIRLKMSLAAKKRMSKPGYVNPNDIPGVREKISKAHTGKKVSLETRKKNRIRMLKQWHGNNWDKVIFTPKKIAAQIRHSKEHDEWRISVFKRDNFVCQVCKKGGGELQAHHIKPFANYPEMRFDINNGQTVHKKCHNHKGFTWKIRPTYQNPNWGSQI